jgi:hypothetical protein
VTGDPDLGPGELGLRACLRSARSVDVCLMPQPCRGQVRLDCWLTVHPGGGQKVSPGPMPKPWRCSARLAKMSRELVRQLGRPDRPCYRLYVVRDAPELDRDVVGRSLDQRPAGTRGAVLRLAGRADVTTRVPSAVLSYGRAADDDVAAAAMRAKVGPACPRRGSRLSAAGCRGRAESDRQPRSAC